MTRAKQKPAKPLKAKAKADAKEQVKVEGKKKKIDLAAMRAEGAAVDTSGGADWNVKITQTVYPLRKPGAASYFMVDPRPEYRVPARILQDDEEGEIYLLAAGYNAPENIQQFVKQVLIVICVTTRGMVHVWPIKLSHKTWGQSGLTVANAAMKLWIRTHLQRGVGGFGFEHAPEETQTKVKPQWSELPPEEILEKAFDGKIVDSDDHPFVRALQGKV